MSDLQQVSLREINGVGIQMAKHLEAIGIKSAADLIQYYPFRYEDYRLRDLTQVQDGDKITVQGQIYGEPVVHTFDRNKTRLTCKVMVDRFLVTAIWFNRQFMKSQLHPGREIILSGKWDMRRKQLTVTESEFPGAASAQTGALQPVYSVGGPISQKWMRKTIKQAISQYGQMLEETLPASLVAKHGLMSVKSAILTIHQPNNHEDGQTARKRLVYEELFLFQLKLHAFRVLTRNKLDGMAHDIDAGEMNDFIRALPFKLTASQKQVTAEILRDMREPSSMNRLLQGDVGSGKTIVAAISLFASVRAGFQAALMVPTEILAEQHNQSLTRLFSPYSIQIGHLTGSVSERQRREILASLQMGIIDIVIGTHALIQEDVYFRKLGLVVTDEQHRFGVNQRSVLRRKGMNPDVLTMTATPIPRTLAITAFGDMDVSTLRELPKGRKPVKTYWVKHEMLERIVRFIGKQASMGRQVYVICPLIEESEKLDVQNALDVHAGLQHTLANFHVGLLHGRLSAQEKEERMRQFSEGMIDVLVSTTVVEVGVDVANATLMVVYDADRFGLSQLHQLRGRVGRGEDQSYCILIADPKNEIARERMLVMAETNDGFEIARRDLELRGPGDFFGTKQSGLPEFRLADIAIDFELLEMARDDATELASTSEFWTAREYLPLRQYLQQEQIFQGDMLD